MATLFTTRACAAHGHAELTLRFEQSPVIPDGERLLLDYFEGAVAAGTQFKPGQTIGLGGHLLRLSQRGDGTLGVEEPIPSPNDEWVEAVDRTVREVTFQRWICESVKLPLSFAPPGSSLLATECTEEAEAVLLTRVEPDASHGFSGWMLSCPEDHEHGEHLPLPLLALSKLRPFCVQFLALPPETVVLVTPPGHGHVFHRGQPVEPGEKSYLASLNAR